jgi:hypothetical protein
MILKPWDKLSREEQDLYVTLLWQDGYSERAIADFLNTTKGRIVRRRNTGLELKSAGRPKREARVDPARFAELLDLIDMEVLEEQGIASIAPPAPHHEESPKPQSLLEDNEVPLAPSPAKEPKKITSAPDVTVCQWPLSDSTKLRPHLCGKQVVLGHCLCEEHLMRVHRYSPPPSI